jgi:hypothetical protein
MEESIHECISSIEEPLELIKIEYIDDQMTVDGNKKSWFSQFPDKDNTKPGHYIKSNWMEYMASNKNFRKYQFNFDK